MDGVQPLATDGVKAVAPVKTDGFARPSREELLAEAKVVGLGGAQLPTLEAVERRRIQLWLVSIVILLGVSSVMAVASFMPKTGLGELLRPNILRVAMLALTGGFALYTIEKELHLRRLTRLLIDEQILTAALSNRLLELGALLEAGKAINSVLELHRVLDIILGSVMQLLEGESGSIMLLEGSDRLRAACTHGNDAVSGVIVPIGEGIAGRVARTREPVLVTGRLKRRSHPVDTAMSLPLLHRGELLGVLNVNGSAGRSFTEYDLRATSLFGEQAAAAIANARLYEAERRHVAELVELERSKNEFLAAVSHDLRSPLTSLRGSARLLHRADLSEENRNELAEMIERQAKRLSSMVDNLLVAAQLEQAGDTGAGEAERVELCAIIRELVDEYATNDWTIETELPESCEVVAQPEALRRILTNLVDNAFRYGEPPITVAIEPTGDAVVLSVADHGTGIAEADRDRVFDRFYRVDHNRGAGGGIGLGLSIVKSLAETFGGSVRAAETPGGGTRMEVRLRAAPAAGKERPSAGEE